MLVLLGGIDEEVDDVRVLVKADELESELDVVEKTDEEVDSLGEDVLVVVWLVVLSTVFKSESVGEVEDKVEGKNAGGSEISIAVEPSSAEDGEDEALSAEDEAEEVSTEGKEDGALSADDESRMVEEGSS